MTKRNLRVDAEIDRAIECLKEAEGLIGKRMLSKGVVEAIRLAQVAVEKTRKNARRKHTAPDFTNYIRVAIVDDLGKELSVDEMTDDGKYQARYSLVRYPHLKSARAAASAVASRGLVSSSCPWWHASTPPPFARQTKCDLRRAP